MKKINVLILTFVIVIVAILNDSCRKPDSDPGMISIRLTDTAGPYQEVNVEILQVSVHSVPNGGKGDWVDLSTNSGVYDLLKLQNGIDTSLVDPTSLPSGKITQMRLKLGNNNSVKLNNVIYPMKVPSGNETGIKLIGEILINPNQTLTVLLDFDANSSVVYNGANTYHLKPTIKVL